MFEFLRLAPPPLGPQPVRPPRQSLRVPLTDRVGVPLPIIAYDLPWSTVDGQRASVVADALDELGLAVTALRCELGESDSQAAAGAAPQTASFSLSNRFCPYRPERYGLRMEDLTTAKVIDIRLAASRDSEGRFSYSPAQMRRWDLRSGRKADRGAIFDTPMPAMHWPPDVRSLDRLPGKVSELRQLAPATAICISLAPDALEAGLPMVLESGADILALRADDWPQSDFPHSAASHPEVSLSCGRQLAASVTQAREWLDAHGGQRIRLIVVPPPAVDPWDCVKILALGADMVAVDGWCAPILQPRPKVTTEDWAAVTLGVPTRPAPEPAPEVDTAGLKSRIERMTALIESTGVTSVSELGPQHLEKDCR